RLPRQAQGHVPRPCHATQRQAFGRSISPDRRPRAYQERFSLPLQVPRGPPTLRRNPRAAGTPATMGAWHGRSPVSWRSYPIAIGGWDWTFFFAFPGRSDVAEQAVESAGGTGAAAAGSP